MKLFNFNTKTEKKETHEKEIFSVEGNAEDLLQIGNNGEMKQTRLFYLISENEEENQETLDVAITSTNPYKSFPIFDKLLGKKIKITVTEINED